MKIGIMSMQRVINYGSFMQSYSLKKNLESLGAEVIMVDFHVGDSLIKESNDYQEKGILRLLARIKSHMAFAKKNDKETMSKYWQMHHLLNENYNKNILPLLGVSQEKIYNPELDLLVIGSDEVFNCLQPNPAVGYSKELFGFANNAKKLISYAASFGNTVENGLRKYGIYDEIKDMLLSFNEISVRDDNSLSIVKGMGIGKVLKHVDPVFLYDYDKESDFEVPLKDYIIVYSYPRRMNKVESAAIIRFARKHKKKIVCIEGVQDYLDGYIPVESPFEVYSYFKHADYIITDTFHGTVFSIKNNKKFVSIVRAGTEGSYGNSSKMIDLLKTFELEDRRLTKISELDKKITKPVDYDRVNEIICSEKEKALNYLSKYVTNIN